MLANRIALGPGLSSPRFRWVPFDDALLFPLDTRNEAARSPDTRSLYPREAALLRRFLKDLGFDAPPATLDDYVTRVVVPTLRRQREAGAVAIKFEAAYLRALDFDSPDSARAAEVYARYAAGGGPSPAGDKAPAGVLVRSGAGGGGRLGPAGLTRSCSEPTRSRAGRTRAGRRAPTWAPPRPGARSASPSRPWSGTAISARRGRVCWPDWCFGTTRRRSITSGCVHDGATRSLADHAGAVFARSEEHTSELQSLAYLVCRLLLEKKKK